jgi:hypothetical protein
MKERRPNIMIHWKRKRFIDNSIPKWSAKPARTA